MQNLGYEQSHQQSMKFSPKMMQNIKLLALSSAKLTHEIKEKVQENPALELGTPNNMISYEGLEGKLRKGDLNPYENSSDSGRQGQIRTSSRFDSQASDTYQGFIEGVLTQPETLQEHLLQQLRVERLSQSELKIGEFIIGNLDSHGFFSEPMDAVLKELEPKPEKSVVDSLQKMIQRLEPEGTAVSGYRESLKVQAEIRGDAPEFFEAFLKDSCFELLGKHRYPEIMKRLGINKEEIHEIKRYFTLLNPYPGSIINSKGLEYVIPDLSITSEKGQLFVQVNSDSIPSVELAEDFKQYVAEDSQSKEVKSFAREQLSEAEDIIFVLEMRQSTLRKIGAELLDLQREFFEKGPKYLRPLTQKEMAQRIKTSESTVSRMTTSKYIQTDWGIFPLKIFFSSAVKQQNNGSDISKNSMKELIKEIIENYHGEKRLSDQKITDILQQQGYKVARRTVTKYRQELNIASSFDRGSL